MQDIENVVASESGTVEAPPERAFSLKLPSGLVTVHDVTFFVFQNIEVREPTGTEEGTAQTSAKPTADAVVDARRAVVVATVVVACLSEAVFLGVAVRTGAGVTGFCVE